MSIVIRLGETQSITLQVRRSIRGIGHILGKIRVRTTADDVYPSPADDVIAKSLIRWATVNRTKMNFSLPIVEYNKYFDISRTRMSGPDYILTHWEIH